MKWVKKHKKLCIFLVIAVVVAVIIARFVSNVQKAAESMMSMLNQRETAVIEYRSLVESVSATGSVTSSASKSVMAEVSGVKALSVPVQVGDMVQEGDLLCLLDTADLEEDLENSQLSLSVSQQRTRLDLDAAQRGLTEAGISVQVDLSRLEEQVASALKDYEKAQEAMSKAGSSYGNANNNSTALRRELEGYQAQLAQVHEKLNNLPDMTEAGASGSDSLSAVSGGNADNGNTSEDGNASDRASLEAEARRLEQLITETQMKYGTAQETERGLKSAYDSAIAAADNAYDAYNRQLQSQEDAIRSGGSTLLSRQDSVTSSQLNASTSGLSDKQQIDRYKEQIEACTVTAPVSSVVTAVSLEEGNSYNGGVIVTIEDISRYEVTVEIDEYDISKIREGQKVVIKTNGTGDLELQGEVISIAPRASAGSGVTYTVRTSIDTPCEDLRMDMTAKLSIIISSRENVLTVPYSAVQTAEDGSFYVEVADENGGVPSENPDEVQAPGGGPSQAQAGPGQQGIPDGRDGQGAMPNVLPTRRIPVTKGIESDYYVEISGEGIEEGLEVIVPADEGLDDLSRLLEQMGPMGGF